QGRDQREAEQDDDQVPGERGPTEHAGRLAGLGGLLADLRLGQRHLLPEQGRQVLADLADELTDRGGAGVAHRFGGVRHGHRTPPSVSGSTTGAGGGYVSSSGTGVPVPVAAYWVDPDGSVVSG